MALKRTVVVFALFFAACSSDGANPTTGRSEEAAIPSLRVTQLFTVAHDVQYRTHHDDGGAADLE